MRITFFILFILFVFNGTCQQEHDLDSLNVLLSSSQHDSVKIKSIQLWDDQIYNSKPGLDVALNEAVYELASKNLKSGQLTKEESNFYKKSVISSLNILGINSDNLGSFNIALDYYYKALSYAEELNDEGRIGGLYNNIGLIHQKQSNFNKALQFYSKALALEKKTNDDKGMATALNNLGNVYLDKGQVDSALYFYERSLNIAKTLNLAEKIGSTLENIGVAHKRANRFDSAEVYYSKSLQYFQNTDDYNGMSNAMMNLGTIYNQLNQPKRALKECLKSYGITVKYDLAYVKSFSCDCIYRSYKKLGMSDSALFYFEILDTLSNYLRNDENMRYIAQKELSFEHEKQQVSDSIKRKNEIEISNAELSKVKTERENANLKLIIALGGGIVILIIVFLIYNRLKIVNYQKTLIEEQKQEVEQKNTEITDSINYAQRIQKALLRSEEHVSKLFPPHFILFKPKDIVSGDFYWAFEKKEYLYISVADCTGHGVPGAFMSMLGISYLNEICNTDRIITPSEIMDELRSRIIKELGQTGSLEGSKDGMDMCILRINLKTQQLEWAGANNPLYIIRDMQLEEIKADRQPVAYFDFAKPFTNHQIEIKKGDSLYMFSDGYIDQFGGKKGKKFKAKKFKEMLLEIHNNPMESQKEELFQAFTTWKGDLEQIDDVCVIGLKM